MVRSHWVDAHPVLWVFRVACEMETHTAVEMVPGFVCPL
ncbi:unnamed protein product [Rhodiola kirilowii]